jgi:two-component system, NtrC family, sensor kinase
MSPIPAFLVALFLIPFTQKFLRLSEQLPLWHERLRIGRIVGGVLCGIEFVFDDHLFSPLIFFSLIALVAIPTYLLKEKLPNARLLLWTIAPATIVLLIDNLFKFWTPNFYNANEDGFSGLVALSLIASTVLAIIARKQQKAFEVALKEQEIKLQVEEENNKILEAKKLDLEYQVGERTAELIKQKEELQQALETLKATQAQLIQSEKLASLGELTAGIAHEIQNPLNFVTNFAELSVELMDECPHPPEGAIENWIPEAPPLGGWGPFFTDIRQNLEKINYHGKRASSIVKGMLEHSRTSTGIKELTDINKLADEYLRLSYHGMRAKDNRFNANFELIAEPYLPLINAVPQDIGRVLLNLINNAFQACAEQSRSAVSQTNLQGLNQAKVTVTTNYTGGQIVINVQDNGSGMSEAVKAKIFQPFFTTKPSGEGTGLGLSLSYDIITKGHNGTIDVESTEGVGTTFIVKLPIHLQTQTQS